MSISLRQRLNELASAFASQVLDAIRGASLGDLVTGSTNERFAVSPGAAEPSPRGRTRSGRLPRRTEGDIAEVIDRIVFLLKQNPNGLRAEQIRDELALQAKELPRPLKEALDSGRVSKSGQKRATTYFAKGAGSKAEAAVPLRPAGGAKKGAKKGAQRAKHAKRGNAVSRATTPGRQGGARGSGPGARASAVARKGGRGEGRRPAGLGEDRPAERNPAPASSVPSESAPPS